VAMMVQTRHVWPMDQQFYIDRTRTCWLPVEQADLTSAALAGQRYIDPRALDAAGKCLVLMRGWSREDGLAAWADGGEAWLEVPRKEDMGVLVLTLTAAQPGPVTVTLEGRAPVRARLAGAPHATDVILKLTPDEMAGRLLVLRLKPDYASKAPSMGLVRIDWMK